MKNYDAWTIEPLQGMVPKEQLYRHLVGWAILAPNSHNSQPWRFILRLEENCIDVCLDRQSILPASDKNGRQAHISVGCAIENLVIAANYYCLKPTLEFLGANFYPQAICRIRLDESSGLVDSRLENLLRAIKKRRMNRGEYQPDKPIPGAVADLLKRIEAEYGVGVDFITDAPTRFVIAQIQYTADKYVVASNDFRRELGEFLLPNDTRSGKGMPGVTFGMADALAVEVHNKLKSEGEFDPDLAHGIAQGDYDGIRSSPLIGVISVEKDEPIGWLSAGRAFQQIALIATMNGLAVAVHAAIIEVGVFNSALRLRLGRFKGRPTVIFRIGYPTRNFPHSPRMSAEEVLEL